MITDITGLREVRSPLTMDDEWGERAAAFLYATLEDWQLLDLLMPVGHALHELVQWIGGHGTSEQVSVSITWDQTLLFVELHDHGGLVPEPHVSRVDAELATRLLAPPAVEWGADLDSRGRLLWVGFAVQIAVPGSTSLDERRRSQ